MTDDSAITLFRMTIHDVFTITGRGIVVAGTIESGVAHVGDTLRINAFGTSIDARVLGIEMVCRPGVDPATRRNDQVGLLLGGVLAEQIEPGQIAVVFS